MENLVNTNEIAKVMAIGYFLYRSPEGSSATAIWWDMFTKVNEKEDFVNITLNYLNQKFIEDEVNQKIKEMDSLINQASAIDSIYKMCNMLEEK